MAAGVNLSDWALRHRALVWFFMLMILAAGLRSYFRLGRNEDPPFTIKTMVVQASWPGATVEETIKGARASLDNRNAEHQEELKAMADLRSEVQTLKNQNHEQLARLQALRDQFQKTYHTNLEMLGKRE